jgi:flagellar hook assembly protein FlgD
MNVNIRIYSMSGQLVKTLEENLSADSYRTNEIQWDGTDSNGMKIGTGMYVYILKAGIPGVGTVLKSSKLVFIK